MKNILFLLCLALAAPTVALGQTYPSKPIRFIVPFPPGGGNDLIARITGQKLAESMGQPVVIENRAGASGQIGAQALAAAAPDGYTIGTAGTHNTVRQGAGKEAPYDVLKDFTPISLLVLQPNVLVVHPSVPAQSLKELIALAKAQPGKLNYGVGSNGSAPHIASEVLKTMAGIDIVHVPYNGAAPALKAVLANEVTMVFDNPATSIGHIQSGKLRALAVSGKARAPQMPDVPTVAEAALPGFEVNSWFGVVGPANMPKPVVDRLSAEFSKAVKLPDVRERLTQQGFTVVGGTAEDFGAHLRADIANWKRMIDQSGARID
jgi:tripartite-type tricarboxylate transporter receptor subunit TctC